MKPSPFWFHYNKPASLKAKAPRLTIHWMGQAFTVKSMKIQVPTFTRIRRMQPHVVLAGKAQSIEIARGHATIS